MNINTEKKDVYTVVSPEGEIDLHNSPVLRKVLKDVTADVPAVIVDLSGVPYMDSSGLATLVEAYQDMKTRGKRFILCSLGEGIKNIFSITRLDEVFPVFAAREAAVADIVKA